MLEDLFFEVSKFAEVLGIPNVAASGVYGRDHALSMAGTDCTLIKGDNLQVLTGFAVAPKILFDFCYIDPPYNTGQIFAYSDARLSGVSPLWGKHSDWMAYMLPRLVLIKNSLKKEGVLAVSIDDYEYVRLKILLDVVFGEENCIATIVVCRSKNGKGSRVGVAVNHEYVLIYGCSKNSKIYGLPERRIEGYDKRDAHGWYKVDGLFRKKGDASRREDRPNMFYPLYYDDQGNVYVEKTRAGLNLAIPVDAQGVERRWLWGIDKAREESWKLYASKAGVIYVKNYLTLDKRVKVRSVWDDVGYLTDKATTELKEIFGEKIFETPKPIALIEDLIECCAEKNALILDCFAGAGTTAHAGFRVNQKDGGCRKVVLVEQNIFTPEGHISREHGFKTLASISEGRLLYLKNQFHDYSYDVIDW